MSSQDTSSGSHENLLDSFTAPSLDQWREEVERLLKGAHFAKKMFTKTVEGLTVNPMYTAADCADLPWQENAPGQWPYLRGADAAKAGAWLVAQELPLPTVEEFNNAVRSDLKRGQSAVNLVLDQAGLNGQDPDQCPAEEVGCGGTSVASLADLETALDGVDLEQTPVFVQAGTAALPLTSLLLSLLEKQGKKPAALKGCLGSDPVFGLARHGKLPLELNRLYDELAVISRWAASEAPELKTLPVHEDPWHDGGADSALGLGLTLASAVQKLRAMEERGLEPDVAAARIQFNLCFGSDFFMEIAKVRALRLLWSNVLAAADCSEVAGQVKIHGRTSRRTQTLLDAHVNMLRSTTQAMSAVLGGVDSLHVSAFDEVDCLPDEFSRRTSRNIQLVLAHECHFDQVQDAAGGSWYVEKLTAELAEQAWSIFQEVEAAGGIVECLKSGWVQQKVADAAELRLSRLATRKDVLVGTNQFANPSEPVREIRIVNHEELKTRRAEALKRWRTNGDPIDHLQVLGRLEKILEADPRELLNLMTDAANKGATLGELTGILRHDTAADFAVEPMVLRRDAEAFENLRGQVLDLGENKRVFTACLGDMARYMPRLDFTLGFFQVGGFEIVSDGFFETADEAVAAAKKSGAATVVLVGLDDTYNTLAAATVRGLASLSPPPKLVLAGGSAELLAELQSETSVQSINMRSNVLDFLGQMAADLGVQS